MGCNCCEYPYHEPARGNGGSTHDVRRRAKALGYKNVNKTLADHVEEDDLTKRYPIVDNLGRRQKVISINKSGLYALILSSKLKEAKPVEVKSNRAEVYAEPVEAKSNRVEVKSNRAEVKSNRVEAKSNRAETNLPLAKRFCCYAKKMNLQGNTLAIFRARFARFARFCKVM